MFLKILRFRVAEYRILSVFDEVFDSRDGKFFFWSETVLDIGFVALLVMNIVFSYKLVFPLAIVAIVCGACMTYQLNYVQSQLKKMNSDPASHEKISQKLAKFGIQTK